MAHTYSELLWDVKIDKEKIAKRWYGVISEYIAKEESNVKSRNVNPLLVGVQNGTSTMDKVFKFSYKLNMGFPGGRLIKDSPINAKTRV